MAAVVVSVPSEDIRAVGISIRPIAPKSDAVSETGRSRKIKKRVTLCIVERITFFPKMKKGIMDALSQQI
jgi:hypothetical protein